MNRTASRRVSIALVALLLTTALSAVAQAQAPASQANSMSIWQARRTITTKLKNSENVATYVAGGWVTPLRFSADGFEFDRWDLKENQKTVKIDLRFAPAVKVTCSGDCKVTDESGKSFSGNIDRNLRWFFGHAFWRDIASNNNGEMASIGCRSAGCTHAAQSSAAAFNVLRAFAMGADSPLRTFSQRAATWRALPTKPPIPEEVRVQRLMAEDAVKEKEPEQALNYYESGIEFYPTWPEGRFNAALIAAELKYYSEAIEHMQAYLELVPDAADAQAARDQLTIWQHKAGQQEPTGAR